MFRSAPLLDATRLDSVAEGPRLRVVMLEVGKMYTGWQAGQWSRRRVYKCLIGVNKNMVEEECRDNKRRLIVVVGFIHLSATETRSTAPQPLQDAYRVL